MEDPARRARISFIALEVPDHPRRRAQINRIEVQVDDHPPRQVQISGIELETPVEQPRRAQISNISVDVPTSFVRRAQISHVEWQVDARERRRAQISRIVVDVPDTGAPNLRRAQISAISLEEPSPGGGGPEVGPRRAQISQIALETPDTGTDTGIRRAQISAISLELPAPEYRRAQISSIALEVPPLGAMEAIKRRAQISHITLEVPVHQPRRAQISLLGVEVPLRVLHRAQISALSIEVPDHPRRRAQISFIELETPAFVSLDAVSDLRRLLGDFTHMEFSDNDLRRFLLYGANEAARRGLLLQAQEVITLQPGVLEYALHPRWVQTFAMLHDAYPAEARTLTLIIPEYFGRFSRIDPTIPPGPPQAVTIWQGRMWVSPIPDAPYPLDHKFFALPAPLLHEQVYDLPPAFVRLPVWSGLAQALRSQGNLEASQAVTLVFDRLLELFAATYRATARDSRDESALPR